MRECRKIECENLLAANKDTGSWREEPKLSFEADQKRPCFASGLEVKFSEKYGNHITTNRDLEIGQTVIVERAFIHVDTAKHHCDNCYRRKANLIPCERCVTTMFCSEECRIAANEKFHGVLCQIEMLCEFATQRLVLRSLITAIKMFPSFEALMDAVE